MFPYLDFLSRFFTQFFSFISLFVEIHDKILTVVSYCAYCSIWTLHSGEIQLTIGQESTSWTQPRTGSKNLQDHITTWMIDLITNRFKLSMPLYRARLMATGK